MKKLLLLSLVLLCSLSAWTAQRSPEEALSIARTFFMQSSGAVTRNIGEVQLVAVSNDLLKSASTRSVEGTAFYIYNYAQSAYVIVSGDDRMKPVLGYSDNGSFITESLPINMVYGLLKMPAMLPVVILLIAKAKNNIAETVALLTVRFSLFIR